MLLVFFIAYLQCSNQRNGDAKPAIEFRRCLVRCRKNDSMHAQSFRSANVFGPVVQEESIQWCDAQSRETVLVDFGRWLGNSQVAGVGTGIEFREPFAALHCVAN